VITVGLIRALARATATGGRAAPAVPDPVADLTVGPAATVPAAAVAAALGTAATVRGASRSVGSEAASAIAGIVVSRIAGIAAPRIVAPGIARIVAGRARAVATASTYSCRPVER